MISKLPPTGKPNLLEQAKAIKQELDKEMEEREKRMVDFGNDIINEPDQKVEVARAGSL